nr:MAG TPA: hypothetical protein [Caudoviricetes sp.]DAK77150.1 MAG TPA: hypothetical protein [Caudoviricetes sp.]
MKAANSTNQIAGEKKPPGRVVLSTAWVTHLWSE